MQFRLSTTWGKYITVHSARKRARGSNTKLVTSKFSISVYPVDVDSEGHTYTRRTDKSDTVRSNHCSPEWCV